MNVRRVLYFTALCIASTFQVGCGTRVPDVVEVWEQLDPDATRNMELQIKHAVYCDLRDGVREANKDQKVVRYLPGGKGRLAPEQPAPLPDYWGAQVTLSFMVDEKSAVNPSASLKTPIHNATVNFDGQVVGATPIISALTYSFASLPQSYAFGLGGTISSQAQRTDKFNAYYSVADLMTDYGGKDVCEDPPNMGAKSFSSPFSVVSNLGIKKWLADSTYINNILSSSTGYDKTFKADAVTYDIKFIIVTSGSLSPAWNLVRIAANTAPPLFQTDRIRTHSLIITVGPGDKSTTAARGPVAIRGRQEPAVSRLPSFVSINAHLSSQIGLEVSNAFANSRP